MSLRTLTCKPEGGDEHGGCDGHVACQAGQQEPPEDGLLPDGRAHRHHHKVYHVAHLQEVCKHTSTTPLLNPGWVNK